MAGRAAKTKRFMSRQSSQRRAGSHRGTRGPAPVHREAVVTELRDRIVAGDLSPGDRLPSHRELMARHGLSLVTVQQALKSLAAEGFIYSGPRRGRFVAAHPPHKHRFAVALPGHPEAIHTVQWTRRFAALLAAAGQYAPDGDRQWVVYFDVDADPDDPTGYRPGCHRLEADIAAHRLAGVLITPASDRLAGSSLAQQRTVPIAITGSADRHDQSLPVLTFDRPAFVQRAMRHLIDRGCQRIGWVARLNDPVERVMEQLQRADRVGAAEVRPEWVIPAHTFHPDWLQHSLNMLLNRPAHQRPDGLVIGDDHLVEPAAAALNALNVPVPDELALVGHWNFPLACEAQVPVHLLGFDADEQLRLAAELLTADQVERREVPVRSWQQFIEHGGKPVPLHTLTGAADPDASALSTSDSA